MRHHSSAVQFAKRGLDIALATVMIVALLPAMVLFAILVKLDSSGPIFYSQVRVGENKRRRERRKNGRRETSLQPVLHMEGTPKSEDNRRRQNHLGRPFPVLKFRTMVTDAETNGPQWCEQGDPRITRFGRLLRRTHLDELPQLINILIGDMSFVGPRPERPEFVSELTKRIPRYHHRLALKPGLTGLAQIRHRADVALDDVRKKVRYDLLYLKNASVFTDIKIIFGTIPLVFGISVEKMRRLRKVQPRISNSVFIIKALKTDRRAAVSVPANVPGDGAQDAAATSRASDNGTITAKIAVILAITVLFNSGCATSPQVRPLARPVAKTEAPSPATTPAPKNEPVSNGSAAQADSKLGRRVSALIMKSEIRLGPEDMIEVRVKDHPELTAQVAVDPWGFVKLPYVQSLQIAGLTEDMVEDILTQKYAEFFRQPPEVEVTVLQYNSQTVIVLGAVGSPGRYPLVKGKPMTLLDVIVAAGLPLPSAALWRVWVVRQGDPGKGPTMRYIDLYKILYRGKFDDNVQLNAGDVVYVPMTLLDSFISFIRRILAPITGVAGGVVSTTATAAHP